MWRGCGEGKGRVMISSMGSCVKEQMEIQDEAGENRRLRAGMAVYYVHDHVDVRA